MSSRRKILVTGATGHVGGALVGQLSQLDVDVRALVRNPDTAHLPGSVDVARGDLTDLDSVRTAALDTDAVFLLWPLQDTAAVAGVLDALDASHRRIVYLSAIGADDVATQGNTILDSHRTLEREVGAAAKEWTFVRSGGMATNTLMWAPQVGEGVVRWPFADAGRSLVHEADIAAVAVRALTEDGHVGERYELTGPQTLTQREQIHAIGDAIGKPVRFEELSPSDAHDFLIGQGWTAAMADGALHSWGAMVDHPEAVLPTVEQLTGRPARTFAQWAKDHADDFR